MSIIEKIDKSSDSIANIQQILSGVGDATTLKVPGNGYNLTVISNLLDLIDEIGDMLGIPSDDTDSRDKIKDNINLVCSYIDIKTRITSYLLIDNKVIIYAIDKDDETNYDVYILDKNKLLDINPITNIGE